MRTLAQLADDIKTLESDLRNWATEKGLADHRGSLVTAKNAELEAVKKELEAKNIELENAKTAAGKVLADAQEGAKNLLENAAKIETEMKSGLSKVKADQQSANDEREKAQKMQAIYEEKLNELIRKREEIRNLI